MVLLFIADYADDADYADKRVPIMRREPGKRCMA
jgi:hypothetical protein